MVRSRYAQNKDHRCPGRMECDQRERGLRLIADGYESILQFLKDSQAIQSGALEPNDLKGLKATFRDARISVAVIQAVNASLRRGGEWVDLDLT